MSCLIDRLLCCPRDRRVDETYMLSVALSRLENPDGELKRLEASHALTNLLRQSVALVLRREQIIPYRGIRAVIASECDVAIASMARKGWIDPGLEQVCMQARRTSQCVLPVILPLLKVATERAGGKTRVVTRAVPEVCEIDGMPCYALDMFTRPGRLALSMLARRNLQLTRLLGPLPSARARMDALGNILFAVEGGLCSTELSDRLFDELKLHSQGCWTGLSPGPMAAAMSVMQEALPALNEIRADVMGAIT